MIEVRNPPYPRERQASRKIVIFTAAAEARLYKELETSGSGPFPRVIPVFDAHRLKAGIEALQANQLDWIFEQLKTGPHVIPLGVIGL
jgi:hypothetical protein